MTITVILERITDGCWILTFVQFGGLVVIHFCPADGKVSNVLGYCGGR